MPAIYAKKTSYHVLSHPIGHFLMVTNRYGLCRLQCVQKGSKPEIDPEWRHDPIELSPVSEQLFSYLNGELKTFHITLAPEGTPFMESVWQAVMTIPYGETRTYSEIAEMIGREGAARAVGAASGKNPIHIIIPCHRVVGKNGALTGYAGGVDMKKALLELETPPIHKHRV